MLIAVLKSIGAALEQAHFPLIEFMKSTVIVLIAFGVIIIPFCIHSLCKSFTYRLAALLEWVHTRICVSGKFHVISLILSHRVRVLPTPKGPRTNVGIYMRHTIICINQQFCYQCMYQQCTLVALGLNIVEMTSFCSGFNLDLLSSFEHFLMAVGFNITVSEEPEADGNIVSKLM